MTSRLISVTFGARDPGALASFWGGLLGRQVVGEARGARLPASDTQVGLCFVASSVEDPGPNRLHLHLTSSSPDDQQRVVAHALELGGRHVDVGQRPEEQHVVLTDPEGNEFCVIEPDNDYLAGCGRLGEVSCWGSHEVGLFWRDSLGWRLVWDQEGETAIQSPAGGTKVSWDGPPVPPKGTRNRQRFEVATADPPGEVARLVALGARELDHQDGVVELADVDGNEFTLRPG